MLAEFKGAELEVALVSAYCNRIGAVWSVEKVGVDAYIMTVRGPCGKQLARQLGSSASDALRGGYKQLCKTSLETMEKGDMYEC